MFYCDFSITLDIGTLIIAILSIITIIVYFCSKKRLKKLNFDIDECELGLTGGTIRLKCNKIHQQIAFRIWVDINTRVLAKAELIKQNVYYCLKSYCTIYLKIFMKIHIFLNIILVCLKKQLIVRF